MNDDPMVCGNPGISLRSYQGDDGRLLVDDMAVEM